MTHIHKEKCGKQHAAEETAERIKEDDYFSYDSNKCVHSLNSRVRQFLHLGREPKWGHKKDWFKSIADVAKKNKLLLT